MRNLRFLPIAFLIAAGAVAQSDHFAPLRAFEGSWEGATSGKPGTRTTSRQYRFETNGKFMF